MDFTDMGREGIKYAVGVDLGGTSVKAALVSEADGIVFSTSAPTPANEDAAAVLNAIASVVEQCVAQAAQRGVELAGIGIGTPGIVSADGRTLIGGAENIAGWENVALADELEARFHLPVLATNDANAMAIGEWRFGAARGVTDAIFITVGTGIGSAALIDERMWRGHGGRGMEMGHVTVKCDGEPCACGGCGCLEHYASTTALLRRYAQLTAEEIDGRTLVERYHNGDENAAQAMAEHWHYLGHGIASAINVFSPQLVVIGGGISEAGDFYLEGIKKSVRKQVMEVCASETRMNSATLGNCAGALGAASLLIYG